MRAVAEQAHALVEHPSVSDYQLTALHTLRNDAGRLLHRVREGAPWYQRFGLDHNPQLLNAMLPWYGVVNNRLIRDPANVALTQKLSALANSAPNSDQRAQLAKPGYDQLKAWNDAGRLLHHIQDGAPWYQRFGLDHDQQLLDAMLPWYGVANNRLIRDPANEALKQKLIALVNSAPNSDQRTQMAKPGYDQLKAWLMMSRPDKADGAFYAQTMKTVQPTRLGISAGLWQSLSPDLWAFYITELPAQPQWKTTPDAQLASQSRQVLLQQIGRRNAESTLYENMLKSVRGNFADVSLEDMTGGTDARRLFTTDEVVPGMFTRQAWEGGIQQAVYPPGMGRGDSAGHRESGQFAPR